MGGRTCTSYTINPNFIGAGHILVIIPLGGLEDPLAGRSVKSAFRLSFSDVACREVIGMRSSSNLTRVGNAAAGRVGSSVGDRGQGQLVNVLVWIEWTRLGARIYSC